MSRADLTVVPDLENELDALYGLPLGEFTAARNDLAKRLKKAGQKTEAERIAELAKPSISAWAVNQLARRDQERVRELLDAGEALVGAQAEALAGKGADRFDEASRRQRDAVRALTRSATAVLTDAGHRSSDAIKERVASSLRAASVDPEGRRLLEAGRLVEDVESAGLGLLAGIAPAAGAKPAGRTKAAPQRPADARRAERVRTAEQELESARAAERRLAEEAAEAQREADEAAAAARRAADRARAVTAEAASARKAAERAQKALDRLSRR